MESNENSIAQQAEPAPTDAAKPATETSSPNDLKSSTTLDASSNGKDEPKPSEPDTTIKKQPASPPIDETKPTEPAESATNETAQANATANLINEVLQKQLTPLLENLNLAGALSGHGGALQQQLALAAAAAAALQQQQQNGSDLKLNPALLAAQLAAMSVGGMNSNGNSPNKSNGSSPPPALSQSQNLQQAGKLNWNQAPQTRQLMSPTNGKFGFWRSLKLDFFYKIIFIWKGKSKIKK